MHEEGLLPLARTPRARAELGRKAQRAAKPRNVFLGESEVRVKFSRAHVHLAAGVETPPPGGAEAPPTAVAAVSAGQHRRPFQKRDRLPPPPPVRFGGSESAYCRSRICFFRERRRDERGGGDDPDRAQPRVTRTHKSGAQAHSSHMMVSTISI